MNELIWEIFSSVMFGILLMAGLGAIMDFLEEVLNTII